jgi:UDP-2,3-diacylglucosamine pyrophosphatase LpxH
MMKRNVRKFAPLVLCGLLLPLQAAAQPAPAPARTMVFISDMHMGVGKSSDGQWLPTEDFRWPGALDGFLSYIDRTYDGRADLVILGDFLELWQPYPGMPCTDPREETSCTVSETAALAARVVTAHVADLRRLGDFSRRGNNRIQVVPGNHDAALNLPEVWSKVAPAFGKDARVELVGAGIWSSPSGLTVAEHGHQIGGDANRFAFWPKVTNAQYPDHLQRPWGQLFVQKVYNDVENEYPIIDNINPESVGVKYRIADKGVAASAADIARFLRFNLFETSKSQIGQFMSAPEEEQPAWNVELGRAAGHRLVLDSLPPGDDLGALIGEDSPMGRSLRDGLDAEVHAMPDSGILQLCDMAAMQGEHPCVPALASHMAQSLLRSERAVVTPHLAMREAVYPAMVNFVYGHTHTYREPWIATVDGATVSVANTGAFHRVIDEAGFEKRTGSLPRSRALRSLQPEDLPACYTFVVVENERRPMKLWRWYQPEGAAGSRVRASDPKCF